MQISFGKYLAGDVGGTIKFSRTFTNGVKFGIFATFTDVSRSQFERGNHLIKEFFLKYQSLEILLIILGDLLRKIHKN